MSVSVQADESERRELVMGQRGQPVQEATAHVLTGKSVGAYDLALIPWDMDEELLRYQLELRGIIDEHANKLVKR